MNDDSFPSPNRAKHGHRYREDSENYGGATHFGASVNHGQGTVHQWDARSWSAPADSGWAADADWQQQSDWQAGQSDYQAAQSGWDAQGQWDNAAAEWDNSGAAAVAETGWDDSQSDWQATETFAAPTANGWAAPNPNAWASQSRSNWDPSADPSPSGDYRPVYSFRTASGEELRFSGDGARLDHSEPEADADEAAPRSGGRRRAAGGAHRLPAPPTALKGRAAVVAVAAGAVVAAGHTGLESAASPSDTVEFQAAAQVKEIASAETIGLTENAPAGAPQVLNVGAPVDLNQFNDILRKGQQYAADLAAQEAAKLRPLFMKFTSGNYTSGYGIRWGVQHLGVDVAAPIGTPIYAVADGTVLEAGPASGFGMWVRLLHDDGTVTIYGHIDTATVSQGQRVMAGDQIATVGNRGFSTGPHCHFEVWLNGVDKIDPLPWLASRGISLGVQRD